MFTPGPPGHVYDNNDEPERKRQQQQQEQQPGQPPQQQQALRQQPSYLTQQQQALPPNSASSLPFYQSLPTLVHHPPELRLPHYPQYGYNLRLPMAMDEQLHPALEYLPDQTQGRGSETRDDYDPTLTPLPSPAVLRHHREEQEPVMMLFPSSVNENVMPNSTPWDDTGILSSHQVIPPQQTQPIPDPVMHGYEQQHREQELFGQLVSMARSNRSNIWQQTSPDPPWLPQIAEKSSSVLLPPTFGESSASTSIRHEIEPTAFATPQPRKQEQQQAPAWHLKDEREYRLEIIQQPSRARMCGFGDKDRRPISPPPILQLLVRARDGTPIPPQDVDTSFFVVLCDCFDETGTKPANMLLHTVPLSTSQQQQQQKQQTEASSSTEPPTLVLSSHSARQVVRMKNLVGSGIASPSKLYNEQRELGIYFVFQDLSLRSEGRFRLTFSLIDIGSADGRAVNTNSISHVLTTTTSSVFTAYTAKNFPGVVPPTSLSQCFAKQGIKIPTRRDTKTKRKKTSEAKEDEEATL